MFMKAKVHETKDIHTNPSMITRYYVNDYLQCKNAVIKVAENLGYHLAGVNDEYAELLLVGKNHDLIVRIYSYTPRETAIDFFVDKKGFFSVNPAKLVPQWYELLGKMLQFKGLGLHKNG